MQKTVFAIIIFWVLFSGCKKQVEKAGSDNERINDILNKQVLDSILNLYPGSDSSITVINGIIDSYPEYEAPLSSTAAFHYFYKSDMIGSNYFFKKAAAAYLAAGDSIKYAEQTANLGVINEFSGLYPEAIESYLDALEIFNSHNKKIQASKIYNNIGIVYHQLDKPAVAMEYYKKSLAITERTGNDKLSAGRYNNIASVYEESYHNLDSAVYYYNLAYNIYRRQDDPVNLTVTANNLADVYMEKNDFRRAQKFLDSALVLAGGLNDPKILGSVYRNQAKLLYFRKQYEPAKQKALLALQTAQKAFNKEVEADCLDLLSGIYESEGNYQEANRYLKEYYQLKSELAGTEQQLKTEGINIKYKVQEKANKIRFLELQNAIGNKKMTQLWLIIGVLVLFTTGLILFFRLKQKNSKLEILKMQRDISNYMAQLEAIKEKTSKEKDCTSQKVKDKIKTFGLTEREEDVLLLIAQGYTNAEIAKKLFLSINTIKTHTKNIFIKLDVENRIKAAKKVQL